MTENIERAPWRTSSYSGNQGNCVEVAPLWRTSSYSANQGDCIEVAPLWRTASYSANQGECVEVAPLPESVGVRDTKSRARGHFTVTRTTWSAFTRAAARGELAR